MNKVKVNHTGICEGFFYYEGVEVELPDEVLKALGKDSYEVVEPKAAPKKEEVKGK